MFLEAKCVVNRCRRVDARPLRIASEGALLCEQASSAPGLSFMFGRVFFNLGRLEGFTESEKGRRSTLRDAQAHRGQLDHTDHP